MKTLFLDTVNAEKQHKWFASQDAVRRAANNWSHYSSAQKTQAHRMVLGLELALAGEIFINPRQKFIAIKVQNARVRDRKILLDLEAQYEQQGIIKIVTLQGITYRIPKV